MKSIPEKDAKPILMQILGGLRYLNRPYSYSGIFSDRDNPNDSNHDVGIMENIKKRKCIIHYDLKPGKI